MHDERSRSSRRLRPRDGDGDEVDAEVDELAARRRPRRAVFESGPDLPSRLASYVRGWLDPDAPPGGAAATASSDLRGLTRLVVAGLEAVACTWSRAGWEHTTRALAILLRHPDAPPRAWAERQLLPLLRASLATSLEPFERRAPAWSAEAFAGALALALAEAWPGASLEQLAEPAHGGHPLHAASVLARQLPPADGRTPPPRPARTDEAWSTVLPLARSSLRRTLGFLERELSGPGRRTTDAEQALRLREVETPGQAIDHVVKGLLLGDILTAGQRFDPGVTEPLRARAVARAFIDALGVALKHPRASPLLTYVADLRWQIDAELVQALGGVVTPPWSAEALTREAAATLVASHPRRKVDVATPIHTWDVGYAQPLLQVLLDLTALRAWGLLA